MNIKDLDETWTQSKCPVDVSYCYCPSHHKHMGARGLPGYSGSCVWYVSSATGFILTVLSISLFFSFVPSFLFSLVLLRYSSVLKIHFGSGLYSEI